LKFRPLKLGGACGGENKGIFIKAAPGFEPGVEVLQTSALPLGYAAAFAIIYHTIISYRIAHLLEGKFFSSSFHTQNSKNVVLNDT
jgi:hypothetical protein